MSDSGDNGKQFPLARRIFRQFHRKSPPIRKKPKKKLAEWQKNRFSNAEMSRA